MFNDLRYAIRSLLKHPGFASISVLTLALGIGANTALFSVVNGVLLNPLPLPDPDQLVTLHQSKPNFDTGAIPYPNFLDLKKENQTFSFMAISRGQSFSLLGAGEPERISGRYVSAEYFNVLQLQPVLGRTFMPGEDQEGAAPSVVISEALWQRKFGASADVLSKSITLDDRSYPIVGVIPNSFTILRSSHVFVPIGQWQTQALRSRASALALHGIGRLKPGVTVEQARADLNRIMANLAAAYPETNKGNGSVVVPMKERIIGSIKPILLLLLGAVGFVLLVACVNVSNLMLVRSNARTREFAVRAALGAGRWHLLRQSLVESTLLSLVGGGLGLLVAAWTTKAALNVLPVTLPRSDEVQLDVRILLFTLVVSVLTGIIAGLAPALKNTRWRLSEVLKEGGRGASSVRHRAQSTLVAIEVALALVLLIGAGLMIRSVGALWNVDPGFRAENVLSFGLRLSPTYGSSNPEAVRSALRNISDNLASTPGVRAVSLSAGASPLQTEDDWFFWVDGKPTPASQSETPMAIVYQVEPDYLNAMGIPLKQGRFFTSQDDHRSASVVVIDEALARKHFNSENPVGKRLRFPGTDNASEIIGVVGHVKQWTITSDDENELQSQLYFSFRSLADNSLPGSTRVLLRYDGPSTPTPTLINSIRRVVAEQHSQNIVSSPETMNEVIASTIADRRFSMILLGSFAAVALLLASLGIYGVVSYLVGQRTHELGIRMALGAQRADVLRIVLNQGVRMTLAGVAGGTVAAVGLTRLLSALLHGVSPTDPLTFATVSLLLIGVALTACLLPAWRATQVDPLTALRDE